MAEGPAGNPDTDRLPAARQETRANMEPEEYGEWIGPASIGFASLDAEEARFLGPADESVPPAPPSDDSVLARAGVSDGARARNQPGQAAPGGEDRRQAAPPFQSDMLARIAGELRSIKTELVGLKDHFAEQDARDEDPEPSAQIARAVASAFLASEQVQAASAAASAKAPAAAPSGDQGPAAADAAPKTEEQKVMREDLRNLLSYLDRLLESLPEDKIEEFARSEYFELYRRVFERLDLV